MNVYLRRSHVTTLQRAAAKEGVSVALLIRRAIDQYLATLSRKS